MPDAPRIFPISDNAVTVEFGRAMTVETNEAAIALVRHFERQPFPGLIEAVPAIASATLFYDITAIRRSQPRSSAFETVSTLIHEALADLKPLTVTDARTIVIPVSFSSAAALDLDTVADYAGISPEEVISIFLEREYRVYMLGFLPGFAYMGIVDERIASPRRPTPRIVVPRGSVGIAGRQTGIYPAESPGGWQIIGRTEVELVRPQDHPPCIFSPGDTVRFERAA